MSHGASNSDDLNLTSATTQTIVFRFELSGPPFRTERGESRLASLRCVLRRAALESYDGTIVRSASWIRETGSARRSGFRPFRKRVWQYHKTQDTRQSTQVSTHISQCQTGHRVSHHHITFPCARSTLLLHIPSPSTPLHARLPDPHHQSNGGNCASQSPHSAQPSRPEYSTHTLHKPCKASLRASRLPPAHVPSTSPYRSTVEGVIAAQSR